MKTQQKRKPCVPDPNAHKANRSLIRLAVGLCLLLVALHLKAAEVDSVSARQQVPEDAAELLNAEVNRRLQLAVKRSNAHESSLLLPGKVLQNCDKEELYTEAGKLLSGFVLGEIEEFANQLPPNYRRSVSLENSIYRDLGFLDAPSLMSKAALASVVRIGEVSLGADKFGHFFSDGFNYFKHHYLKGRSLEETLMRGELTELSYFGTMATGIYSYADLTANVHGMRFWNELLGNAPDLLTGQPAHVYVRCEGDEFVLQREFKWQDYVDSAWDENVNCNRYETPEIASKVRIRIEETGSHACIGKPHPDLKQLRAFYGQWRERLLNDHADVIRLRFLDMISEILRQLDLASLRQPRPGVPEDYALP